MMCIRCKRTTNISVRWCDDTNGEKSMAAFAALWKWCHRVQVISIARTTRSRNHTRDPVRYSWLVGWDGNWNKRKKYIVRKHYNISVNQDRRNNNSNTDQWNDISVQFGLNGWLVCSGQIHITKISKGAITIAQMWMVGGGGGRLT